MMHEVGIRAIEVDLPKSVRQEEIFMTDVDNPRSTNKVWSVHPTHDECACRDGTRNAVIFIRNDSLVFAGVKMPVLDATGFENAKLAVTCWRIDRVHAGS